PNTTTTPFGEAVLHPAWDKTLRWELHSKPLFRQFVTASGLVSPTNNANVGYLPVQAFEDVAEERHRLDEVVAVDQQQAKPQYYVRIQVSEHGKRIGRTKFLGDSAYIPVDPTLRSKIAVHAADTLDALAADQLYDGTQ